MKQTVFNKLYHRIQHEPKIYGLTFPQLMSVIFILLVGSQVAKPLGLLLSLGASFGMAGLAYLIITRRAKAQEGLGNDRLAYLIKNRCASNEYSSEKFEILEKREGSEKQSRTKKR
jgi:hypothetical protein